MKPLIKLKTLLEAYNNISSLNFEEVKNNIAKLTPIILNNEDLKSQFDIFKSFQHEYGFDRFKTNLIDNFIKSLNDYMLTNEKPVLDEILDKGYSGNKFVGSKYKQTKDLPIKEIANLIKKTLLLDYPKDKFSVSTDVYSGGQSLTVDVVDISFNPFTAEYIKLIEQGQTDDEIYGYSNKSNRRIEKWNEQAKKFIKDIEKKVNEYNYDDTDSQIDYFDKNFYTHIGINEDNAKIKYFENSEETKKILDYKQKYDLKYNKRKEQISQLRGKYKKGEELIYVRKVKTNYIPEGEYKCVVLKSPNGRAGIMSRYSIEFEVPEGFVNGVLTKYKTPKKYRTECFEEELKKA